MTTKAIESVLNEYRVQITDSLATELSRAQRQTEEHSLALINKALAELTALREQVSTARDAALEEAAKVADVEASGWDGAFFRWRDTDTEAADRCSARQMVAQDIAKDIRALKRGG